MRQTLFRLYRSLLIAGVVAAATSHACAQLATLDKGHQLLVDRGLQIWGLDTNSTDPFNYNNLSAANFNAVMWSFNQSNPALLSPGQKWGKWVDHTGSPATALSGAENALYSDLVAIQVGDEQQTDMENPNGATKAWFDAAHSANLYTDKLLYVNSAFVGNISAYANFIGSANPDAISFDSYPFGATGVTPYNWLGKAQQFRRLALGSYIGATGTAARPYGLYLQTYHGGDGARDPSELEMSWQQFTAWTLGYTFVDAFTTGGGNTSLFNSGDQNSPTQPAYNQFAGLAARSKLYGPALTRLISYGYGPDIVLGKDASGATNPVPIDWPVFDKSHAPPSQQYLTAVSAQNVNGTVNGGNPGDVYVGYFNPLSTSYGDPAGTAYFMVTNALGAYLQDPTLTQTNASQVVTMDFDFGTNKINSLQTLNTFTGQAGVIPLEYVSGTKYRLRDFIAGGDGHLFKYNDGTPFVGLQSGTKYYWDSDANAANNNVNTGAGLGGSGNWTTSASNWYDGSANAPWIEKSDVIFAGTAGNVSTGFGRSANSLTFKTTGYTLASGGQLTMTGSYITTDAGVTATINAGLQGSAGLVKTGPGTLVLNGGSSITGGTSIFDGVLVINHDTDLGAVPDLAAITGRDITLSGGTLRLNASITISNRRFMFGPGGGTIDTQSFPNSTFGFSHENHGPGDLTKLGTGTWYAQGNGNPNTLWTGRLIIKEGTWKIDNVSGLPYEIPAADGVKPDQVIFDGGTLTRGSSTVNITNVRRGITVAAGGGTISGGITWAGPVTSSVPNAVLNLNGVTLKSSAAPSTFQGTVNVGAGGLELNGGTAMGDLASIVVPPNTFPPLIVTISGGTETIGSLSGGGTSGGNLVLNSSLITGNNNSSTTFAGAISGSGGLTKVGTGTFTVTNDNNYSGGTTINGGTLLVNNPPSTTGTGHSGTGSGTIVVNSGGTLGGTGNHNGNVTINSGGLANGPAKIFGGVLVNSGGTLAGNITMASGTFNAGVLSVASGGHVAPGASIGTINAESLILSSGSILDYELDTVSGVDKSDLINVTATGASSLQINGGTINLTNLGNMTVGTYTLIDYTFSSFSGSINNLSLGTVPAGFSYSLNNNTTNRSIDLIVSVPEPATWVLCAMAAAVLFFRARRSG